MSARALIELMSAPKVVPFRYRVGYDGRPSPLLSRLAQEGEPWLYLPWQPLHDVAPYYEGEKYAEALRDSAEALGVALEVKMGRLNGWANQPEVVLFRGGLSPEQAGEVLRPLHRGRQPVIREVDWD